MIQRTKPTDKPTDKSTENQTDNISNEYDNLSSHKVLTSTHPKKSTTSMSNSTKSNSTKYQVETVYLGIANNKQVEEEIITILKEQFLSKITTDASYLSALQSSSSKEQIEKREVKEK